MTDLIEFLRARLDEDEQVARAAADRDGEHWEVTGEGDLVTPGTGGSGYFGTGPWGGSLGETGTHIARHDPARALAEVDAKRRTVDWLAEDAAFDMPAAKAQAASREEWYLVTLARTTLKLLALPYVDHPDYRGDWQS